MEVVLDGFICHALIWLGGLSRFLVLCCYCQQIISLPKLFGHFDNTERVTNYYPLFGQTEWFIPFSDKLSGFGSNLTEVVQWYFPFFLV